MVVSTQYMESTGECRNESCDFCGIRGDDHHMYLVTSTVNTLHMDWIEVVCSDCGQERLFPDGILVSLDNLVAI